MFYNATNKLSKNMQYRCYECRKIIAIECMFDNNKSLLEFCTQYLTGSEGINIYDNCMLLDLSYKNVFDKLQHYTFALVKHDYGYRVEYSLTIDDKSVFIHSDRLVFKFDGFASGTCRMIDNSMRMVTFQNYCVPNIKCKLNFSTDDHISTNLCKCDSIIKTLVYDIYKYNYKTKLSDVNSMSYTDIYLDNSTYAIGNIPHYSVKLCDFKGL